MSIMEVTVKVKGREVVVITTDIPLEKVRNLLKAQSPIRPKVQSHIPPRDQPFHQKGQPFRRKARLSPPKGLHSMPKDLGS